MNTMASQITSRTIVYSTIYSGAGQKYIRAPSHWPITWKMFPFDDVIMDNTVDEAIAFKFALLNPRVKLTT